MPNSHLPSVYRPDFGLLTDLYQLTMAYGYFRKGLHRRKSIFHLFYRKPPFGGQFALAAGLPLAIDLIKGLRFSADDVQYLGRQTGADGKPLFNEQFLNYLQRLRFSGDVWAAPEGSAVFPHEPILRIEANLLEAQLLETALLTIINFSTLITTKAARIKTAAGMDNTVLEFGLRRAQGIDGGLTASRSAYLGGCDGTSNVWAGRYYNIPVRGTHAHSWVMVFPDEQTAFEEYASALPNNVTLLVDTYDTLEGTKRAIEIGKKLQEKGHRLLGIRLDSGDLSELAKGSRQLLDEAGLQDTVIVASDSLDEYRIQALKESGAPITVWGVGTRLATAYDQPALGGVYKLAAIENENGELETRVKLSDTAIKVSNPGRLQVRRYHDLEGKVLASQIVSELHASNGNTIVTPTGEYPLPEAVTAYQNLLVPVFQNGEQVYNPPQLAESRKFALAQYASYSALDWSVAGKTGLSAELWTEKATLVDGAGN
ncbi:nicotinate phosphoribosyltransferase [Lewinellaceae bacterium SD302]|nr:nicotinate phosphoribosyltransferase [Lewinellaceae bacterium SD302]